MPLPLLVEELAERFGPQVALLSEQDSLSYRGLSEQANRYARWALAQGLGRGDVVGVMMPNCADYVAAWLGITRVGATAALLNTNLSGEPLAHAIRAVSPKHVIAAAEYARMAVLPNGLSPAPRWWSHGAVATGPGDAPLMDLMIQTYPADPLDRNEHAPPGLNDTALQIYTSGTTGMPKAANVSHFRVLQWSYWFAGLMDTKPTDRMYNCLPMYHSIGGVLAIGALLVNGGSVLLRQRFSTTRFWDDIVEGQCTIFQYIGELCRYLLNSPPHPREREHQLRLCCGNGLRREVWTGFQSRFRIPHMLEFYAATEGNVSLFNCEELPGAIGRIPPFLAHRFPVALIRTDTETLEPVRGQNGQCVRCGPDEAGEAIGAIPSTGRNPVSRFEGYTDKAASERKILRDVFAPGDAWFRTGDLMRKDPAGFFYFVDRLGDTFRWKGENVSAAEVEEALRACSGVVDAAVYGVAVPGSEGRAGMAAIVTGPEFSPRTFWRQMTGRLADYARPLFLRICDTLETTGTFKLTKARLMRDGFDPEACGGAVWLGDRSTQAFVLIDAALYARLRQGEFRL